MSWEVGPTGFATTRIPSTGRGGSAPDGGDETLGLGEHEAPGLLDRDDERRTRSPGVAAATECPGQDRRVDTARFRSDADPRAVPGLLEEDRDLGALGLRK